MTKILSTLLVAALAFAMFGWETTAWRPKYDPVGYKPQNSANVRVKVSLQHRMVYVLEGSKPLLVAATAIGTPAKPTPKMPLVRRTTMIQIFQMLS